MSQIHVTVAPHASGVMEPAPFAMPSKKLAMWLFMMADLMTFIACLAAYAFLRNASPDWPRPLHGVGRISLMTFIMLTSSLIMLMALNTAKRQDKPATFRWMMLAALAGLIFVGLHVIDWMDMINQGVGLFHNPWGPAAFGGAFYVITGFSLLHISVGTIALAIVAIRYRGGRYNDADIEIINLFWQFVGLVWLFIVPAVYLTNMS